MRSNVLQLRELLREKFPGVRMGSEPSAEKSAALRPTGIAPIDQLLRGGLPKAGITELLCPHRSSGSALIVSALLNAAGAVNQITVLIDGHDSFDPAALPAETLRHLLWVRCRDAGQALHAADFVLRDANLPFVILDLALNSAAQLGRIPATTWYRFQRIIEQSATTVLVVTPQKLVASASARLVLPHRFGLDALDQTAEELLAQLRFELEDLRRVQVPEPAALQAG